MQIRQGKESSDSLIASRKETKRNMAELMTVEQVASYLGISKKKMYGFFRQGTVPASKIGHQWICDKAMINEWLERSSAKVMANILVVDDEEMIRSLLKAMLEEVGHRVIVAETAPQALELMKQQNVDFVFLDLKMPGMDGAELVRQIRTIKPKLPITIITGYPDSDMMARALANNPYRIIGKPFNEEEITAAVSSFLRSSVTEGQPSTVGFHDDQD